MDNARVVYMDYNATTPLDPRVFEAMRPFFCEVFGNAASAHVMGAVAKTAVDNARQQVATILGASAPEIIFTSGATESNNLAIKGAADMYADRGRHIITQATEHKAVLDTCKFLEARGCEITFLPVDRTGRVSLEQVERAIRPDTILVSIMWANNEIGTIQPVHDIGRACKSRGVLFHSDATQAVGKVPINVDDAGIDLLSLTGHKLYGPKGAGALYVRAKNPRVRLTPEMHGGGHQLGLRSGTLNVPGIVGLGAACGFAMTEFDQEVPRLIEHRNALEDAITSRLDGVSTNGNIGHRLPHVSNLSFAGVDGERLISSFDDLAVSSGSACTSASKEPSFVLKACEVPDDLAYASVRYSLGRFSTESDVKHAVEKTVQLVSGLRALTRVA